MPGSLINKPIASTLATGPVCGPVCRQTPAPHQSAGHQVADFFTKIFNTDDFPARWHCGNWTDFHGWLYILSDFTIWAAYFAIPIMFIRLMMKRKDIALSGVVVLFLAFVSLCGLTHLMDAVIFWWPAYRLSALLRFATAIVSVIAAYGLNRAFPELIGLRSVKELKREIAKRKKTEERLSASEFLLSEAGRIARVGGWEFDVETRKRSYSKAVYDMLDIPYDYDLTEKPLFSYYPEKFRTLLAQCLTEAINDGKKWDIETPATTLGNRTLWVRNIGEPVFNSQGQVVKVRGTLTDIDQYKRHELELSRALKATQAKTEQLKKFGYVLSHNVRNHTSNLAALSTLTDINELDDDNKDLMLKSRQVTQALTTTLDDLAQVMEAQAETVTKETISFACIADQAIEAQARQISQAQAQIHQSFEVAEVSFPSLYLDNIMKHLISNALRYRKPDVTLRIDLKTYLNDNGNIVLECCDNGLGMDLDLYGHKLFNLYATFHPSVSARGVGLFLIKTQIEYQGGEITVSSQPGEGSTFQVLFKKDEE